MIYNKQSREEGNTDLEQLHKVLIEMLRVIDAICRKHKLQYWLDAGNLLGHVRHNGFIPWDDDIDLCMPRKDYEKFIHIAPKELPNDLFFQYKNVDAKKSKWVKIRDNYSTVLMEYELGKEKKYHQGIFVDIFPYDLLEDDFHNAKIFINRKFQKGRNNILKKANWILNQTATLPVKLIGMERLKDFFLSKYTGPNPKIVSTGIEIPNFYFTFDYDTIFPLKEISFMGLSVFAPNNIPKYLEDMYGDYMAIPKKENRVTHAKKILPFTKCNHPSSIDY